MDWFERLAANRYIEMVMLANNQGRLLRSSRPITSDDELLPSMLQAFEVLAQTLTAEFGCGLTQMVHLATEQGHLLLFPLLESTYYVLVVVERAAPLMLVLVELDRVLRKLTEADLSSYEGDELLPDSAEEMDAAELIEAVQEWLRRRYT